MPMIIMLAVAFIIMVAMVWIGIHEQRKAKRCTWISYTLYGLTVLIAIPWLFYGYIFTLIALYGV